MEVKILTQRVYCRFSQLNLEIVTLVIMVLTFFLYDKEVLTIVTL